MIKGPSIFWAHRLATEKDQAPLGPSALMPNTLHLITIRQANQKSEKQIWLRMLWSKCCDEKTKLVGEEFFFFLFKMAEINTDVHWTLRDINNQRKLEIFLWRCVRVIIAYICPNLHCWWRYTPKCWVYTNISVKEAETVLYHCTKPNKEICGLP